MFMLIIKIKYKNRKAKSPESVLIQEKNIKNYFRIANDMGKSG